MQPMQPLSQQQDILEDEARQKPGFPPLARLGLGIGILVTGYILLRLGGGFPPQSWKLLYATFAGRGAPAPNPDLVIIQSVILLAAWLLLLLVAIQIVRPGRKSTFVLRGRTGGTRRAGGAPLTVLPATRRSLATPAMERSLAGRPPARARAPADANASVSLRSRHRRESSGRPFTWFFFVSARTGTGLVVWLYPL